MNAFATTPLLRCTLSDDAAPFFTACSNAPISLSLALTSGLVGRIMSYPPWNPFAFRFDAARCGSFFLGVFFLLFWTSDFCPLDGSFLPRAQFPPG